MSLFEYFKRFDKILFILIHNDSSHEASDGIMLFIAQCEFNEANISG